VLCLLFGVWVCGLGFRLEVLGLGVVSLRFGVGFRVQRLGFRV